MAKVSIVECREYDYAKVEAAVKKSFEHLGGIGRYINKGDKVLLKINLLMRKRPEEATTTHPAVVKALAKILTEYGAKVCIGDSPGGPFNETMLRGIYKTCGIEQVASEVGAVLNSNYKQSQAVNPDGLILKRITVADMLNDADKVISVSKLKTHGMMVYTGAVKNMFGIIPGLAKLEYHVNMPKLDDFADALIDICMYAKPVLSFMDGIVGMEGAGPSGGEPRKIGVLIASSSPYHLDKAASNIISLKHDDVPTVRRSIARGLCGEGLGDIEFLGEPIEKFIVPDFKAAKVKELNFINFLPKFMRKLMENLYKPKPVFNFEKCIGCGDCAKNCPAKVIEMRDAGKPPQALRATGMSEHTVTRTIESGDFRLVKKPVADMSGCIRCFCCQELCPKIAVDIHRPVLLKLLSR